jgi:hypothetical protein
VIVREKETAVDLGQRHSVMTQNRRRRIIKRKQPKKLAQKLDVLTKKMDTILDLLNSVVGAVVVS